MRATKTFLALRIARFPEKKKNRGQGSKWALIVAVLLCFTVAMGLAGCPKGRAEALARDTIAGAEGFIEEAQANHGDECRAKCELDTVKNKALCHGICGTINQAVDAQNFAIDMLNVYCSGPGRAPSEPSYLDGGECSAQPALEPRLREAIRNLDRIIVEAKGVVR